jgi:hypothetical protein
MSVLTNKKTVGISLSAVLALSAVSLLISQMAGAASLGRVMVRFDRIAKSATTTGTVCAKPTSTATEGKAVVTFPAGFTLGAYTTFTVSTSNLAWPSGASAWTGITAPAVAGDVVGQAVTFASGDLTPGTLYCFNWTTAGAVTNPGTASSTLSGSVATQTTASGAIDSAAYTTNVIDDDSIIVSASVPQSFSFVLSGNTDNLGVLSTGSVANGATPRTVTINTNAAGGWQVWAKDASTGLNSSSAAKTIASTTPGTNSVLSNGSEGYNMGVTNSQVAGSGSISVDTAFVGGVARGGGLDTTLRSIATSNGTADTAVLTLTNHAAIGPLTPAATDYTDTITVIGAGLF